MNDEWSLHTNSALLLYHPYLDRIMTQNCWESKILSHRYFIFSQLNQPYDFFPTRFIRMIAAKFWALCQNTFVVHYSHRIRAPKKGLLSEISEMFWPIWADQSKQLWDNWSSNQDSGCLLCVHIYYHMICLNTFSLDIRHQWLPLSLRHHASIVRD